MPYIAGYLAFREAPALLDLLTRLKETKPELYPQIAFVDGNGTLHPRRFGLACHFGVLADIPCIGVAKNFLEIPTESLTIKDTKQVSREHLHGAGAWLPIVGKMTHDLLGAALRASSESVNPVFVSPGHRVSLATSVALAAACCKYRVPEPVRAADSASRQLVREITARSQ
ncbi:hypothetical protein HK097_002426 [Rhizophlyctis rosea]|uniref:Endonuclease V n=1 Tax=Rhizophlyctis rosea TaxID=64517 RepID=A0AAD5SFI1_9FUNG|nr:hypothetical protein HK097_002426 [Rhizophlyctis rosea]